VRVEVIQLTQGQRSVSCNRDFLIVDPGVDLAWSMVVSASHFVSGSAASNTQATLRPRSGSDGQPQGWQQTVEITKN